MKTTTIKRPTNRKATISTKRPEAQLKLFKSGTYEYIYIYFKCREGMLRVNTYEKYVMYKFQKSQYLYLEATEKEEKANRAIIELMDKVNHYITFKLGQYRGTVNQKECLEYIAASEWKYTPQGTIQRLNDLKGIQEQQAPEKTVMDYYMEFLEYENRKVKGNANSMGNYLCLKTNLEGYQTQTGKTLTFERMNTKIFMLDFHNYLATTKINAKNKTKVYLKTSSVKEKISKLKSFYNWLSDSDIYSIKASNQKVKIAKIHNEPQSLTKDDLRQLQGLKGLTDQQQTIIDIFLANCLMGMRFSDLQLTSIANRMQHDTGEYYLRQTMQKTTSPAQIELLPLSLTILQKYDWSFPKMCLLTFNSHLHKILKEHKLFNEPITRQEHRNNEPQDVTTPRRDLITSHSMRRTFVNLCLQNNVPINTIMLATSHKHVKTLESYIQRLPNPQAFQGIAI